MDSKLEMSILLCSGIIYTYCKRHAPFLSMEEKKNMVEDEDCSVAHCFVKCKIDGFFCNKHKYEQNSRRFWFQLVTRIKGIVHVP